MTLPPGDALLRVSGVTHDYGAVRALDDVELEVHPGEIHALVGENGAGKSTLVEIVAGLVVPTAGTVEAGGQVVAPGSRPASVAAGIGVVHQHFSLVDSLTGTENFLLGRPGTPLTLPLRTARAELAELGERVGLPVDPDALVADLTIGQRQRLEILVALGWGARLLLLDEPSAVLSPTEADALLDTVTRLGHDAGLGVLLITHKLREVEEYADRTTVLRAGRVVGSHVGRVPVDVLVEEMVGAGEPRLTTPVRARSGPNRLRVRHLAGGRLDDVDLDVAGGSVCGLAGVAGSGQTDLVRMIAGLDRPRTGSIEIDGTAVTGDAVAAWAAGLALIPEDRAAGALAVDLPVWANAVTKQHRSIGTWHRVDRAAVATMTDRIVARLGVRPPDHERTAGALSGGNQQRLVIGRELDRSPSVVVAAEPTRGLDPPSAAAVVGALRRAAADGAAVLVMSSDLDELLVMADRLVALCSGRITLDAPASSVDRHDVGRAMTAAAA